MRHIEIHFLTYVLVVSLISCFGCGGRGTSVNYVQSWHGTWRNTGLLLSEVDDRNMDVSVKFDVEEMYHDGYTYNEIFKSLALDILSPGINKSVRIEVFRLGLPLYKYSWSSADVPSLEDERNRGWFSFVRNVIESISLEESVKYDSIFGLMKQKFQSITHESWWDLYRPCFMSNERNAENDVLELIKMFVVFCNYPEFELKLLPLLSVDACGNLKPR